MKPAAHVRSNVSDDGVILLDIQTGQIFSANRIGARIWEELARGRSLADIAGRIASETGADRATVEADVRAFVNVLVARALVADS